VLKIVAGVAMLLLLGFAGQRRIFTKLPFSSGARLIYLTGTEYILVGAALGGGFIGILDERAVRSLTPLFTLGLGFIGLLFGLQLEMKLLRRFRGRFLAAALLQSFVTMVAVFLPFYFLLGRIFGEGSLEILPGALVLATTAGCTAQSSLAMITREHRLVRARVMELLRFFAGVDAFPALIFFGFIFCLRHTYSPFGFGAGSSFQWLFLSVAVGVFTGFLLHLLTQINCSDEELLIMVAGTVLFASGISLYFRLSPLVTTMIVGITVANLPGSNSRIFPMLSSIEKPLYVIFLVLAGAIWHPGGLTKALPLVALYLLSRFAGKIAGGYLASAASGLVPRPPSLLGAGLVSQGGIVIAMVMSFYQLGGGPETEIITSVVIIGVIFNELVAPGLAARLLRRAGEVD